MTKSVTVIAFVLLHCLFAQSQLSQDSLQSVLQKTKVSPEKIDYYLDLLRSAHPSDPESAQMIAEWLIEHTNTDSLRMKQAEATYTLGKFYMDISNYDKAAMYFTNAQDIAEKNNFFILQAKAFNGLAGLYYSNKQIDKAIDYYSKTVALSEKNNFTRGVAIGKFNLGGLLLEKGFSNPDTVQLSFALIREGLGIAKSTNDTQAMINISIGLSQSYLSVEQPDSALRYLNLAESLIARPDNEKSLITFYIRTADVYTYKKNYPEALRYYHLGLNLALKYNSPRFAYNYYEGLAQTYALMGDYKKANEYNLLYIRVHDSLVSKENFAIAADYQNRYERAKKDNQILKLNEANKQKSFFNKIFIASLIVLLLLGFSAYVNIKHRAKITAQREELYEKKISALEKDKQLLAIDSMLKGQEEERSRIAKDLHDGLGCQLSGAKLSFLNAKENMVLTPEIANLFDKSIHLLDDTIGDLRKVAHNLMPEALMKFGLFEALRDFCNSIRYSSGINIEYNQFGDQRTISNTAEVFIYRIIQELVNNAIKHAQASQIIVQLSIHATTISIEVEDNGKGFDKKNGQKKEGAGLDNISYRVNYFNGKLDIDTDTGKGTSVNIELKV